MFKLDGSIERLFTHWFDVTFDFDNFSFAGMVLKTEFGLITSLVIIILWFSIKSSKRAGLENQSNPSSNDPQPDFIAPSADTEIELTGPLRFAREVTPHAPLLESSKLLPGAGEIEIRQRALPAEQKTRVAILHTNARFEAYTLTGKSSTRIFSKFLKRIQWTAPNLRNFSWANSGIQIESTEKTPFIQNVSGEINETAPVIQTEGIPDYHANAPSASAILAYSDNSTESSQTEEQGSFSKIKFQCNDSQANVVGNLAEFDRLVATFKDRMKKRLVFAEFTTNAPQSPTLHQFLLRKAKLNQIICRELSWNVDLIPHSQLQESAEADYDPAFAAEFLKEILNDYDEIVAYDRRDRKAVWANFFGLADLSIGSTVVSEAQRTNAELPFEDFELRSPDPNSKQKTQSEKSSRSAFINH